MFSDEELKLAFAVVAAAAFMKGEGPGVTRVLCNRAACAGPGGEAGGATEPMTAGGDKDCGRPPAPGAEPRGPEPGVPVWPTAAVPAWRTAAIPAWPSAAAPIQAATRHARLEGAQTRLVFAVDIAGFTDDRRDDEVQLALRRALYQLMAEAFDASGISWADCVHEDRGDGVVVLIPQGLPAVMLIDPLLYQLRAALRRHNRMSSEVARIGLRAAVHMGQVHRDEHGLAGTAVNHLFRLLDAPMLRTELTTSGSELALIVSDHYYECVVRQRPSMIESAAFRPVAIKVKQTRCRGWVWTAPIAVDAHRAVAVPRWTTPVVATCTMLWAGGATMIATAGLDPSPAAGLALGVVGVTGLVMAVMTTALGIQATTRPERSRRSTWPMRWTAQAARIPVAQAPATGAAGAAAEAGAPGGALSGG